MKFNKLIKIFEENIFKPSNNEDIINRTVNKILKDKNTFEKIHGTLQIGDTIELVYAIGEGMTLKVIKIYDENDIRTKMKNNLELDYSLINKMEKLNDFIEKTYNCIVTKRIFLYSKTTATINISYDTLLDPEDFNVRIKHKDGTITGYQDDLNENIFNPVTDEEALKRKLEYAEKAKKKFEKIFGKLYPGDIIKIYPNYDPYDRNSIYKELSSDDFEVISVSDKPVLRVSCNDYLYKIKTQQIPKSKYSDLGAEEIFDYSEFIGTEGESFDIDNIEVIHKDK